MAEQAQNPTPEQVAARDQECADNPRGLMSCEDTPAQPQPVSFEKS